jgi:hypothetical protein
MKRIFFSLLLVLTLASCGQTTSDSTSDTSSDTSSSTSDTSSSSSTTPVGQQWKDETHNILINMIGEEIPLISGLDNTYYVRGYNGTTTPYFNPYIKGSADRSSEYRNALLNYGYTFVESYTNNDKEDQIFHKGNIETRYSYYQSEGSYWFDVYTYLIVDSITSYSGESTNIVPTTFNKAYDDISKTVDGVSVNSKGVMNNSSLIQFKSGTSSVLTLSGKTMSQIKIVFNQYTHRMIFKAGTSASSLKPVFNNAGVFALNNATYFQIENNGTGVSSIISIGIYF